MWEKINGRTWQSKSSLVSIAAIRDKQIQRLNETVSIINRQRERKARKSFIRDKA